MVSKVEMYDSCGDVCILVNAMRSSYWRNTDLVGIVEQRLNPSMHIQCDWNDLWLIPVHKRLGKVLCFVQNKGWNTLFINMGLGLSLYYSYGGDSGRFFDSTNQLSLAHRSNPCDCRNTFNGGNCQTMGAYQTSSRKWVPEAEDILTFLWLLVHLKNKIYSYLLFMAWSRKICSAMVKVNLFG